ncbi:MAG: hypothetical protein F4X64_03045, partial [Chloroflexi bacterium]|nr:hypothetical protein [Chloroflexota bacterium]
MAGRRGEMRVRLTAEEKRYLKAMRNAGRATKKFAGGSARALKNLTLGFGALGVGIAAATAVATKKFLDQGDALDKMNRRTGISVEQLQRYDFAAQQSGTSIETLEKGWKRQAAFLNEARKGTKTYTDTLDQLGIDIEEFKGLNTDQAFQLLAQRTSELEDPIERAAVAQLVFGRAGMEMLPLIEDGTDGLKLLMDQADATGNIMSGDTARAAAQFNDRLNILKQGLLGLALEGFGALLPWVDRGLAKLEEWAPIAAAWWQEWLRPHFERAVAFLRDQLIPWIGEKLLGAWQIVWGFIQSRFIPFWNSVVVPAFDNFKKLLAEGVIPAIRGFVTEHGELLKSIAIGAAIFLGLLFAFNKIKTAITIAKVAFIAIKAAVLAFSWPVILIGAIIAGLVILFVHLWRTNEG